MIVEANGTRLWFDIEGPSLVPRGASMHQRPAIVLLHGGPGTYDHSYFKPEFARLTSVAQVVYLDLRGHGRSSRTDPAMWSFETCADDVAAFCDALGIVRPVLFGHSMGGFVAMLHGARHPRRAAGLVLQSTMARFDLARLAAGFREFGGDEVARLAERDYSGDPITDEEWSRVFAVFGPNVPGAEVLARRSKNLELAPFGMARLRTLDIVGELQHVACPTLVCVGDVDPVTPLSAAREIVAALPAGRARLEVMEGAGHFPWLDDPERYWVPIERFVTEVTATGR
jgi:proline iminopeptidase